MQKALILIVGLMLVLAGAFVVPKLLSSGEPPVVRWSEADEQDAPDYEADAANGEPSNAAGEVQRAEVDVADLAPGADERVDAVLRGRVLDKFQQPVASATVWLEFGRGGQRGRGGAQAQRRVPEPVSTDREGRFAFQGQAFRNLQVVLQVAHPKHAVGMFDKDLGAIGAEVDLGDLVLMQGGLALGRVTDLDGNGIAAAQVTVQPENNNRLRFVRDREKLMPPIATDNNGYFRLQNLAAGDWSVRVLAKKHTEGRSPTFVVAEAQQVDLDDIRLGPGFEVTGYVRDSLGKPIAKADVTMRSRGQPGGNTRGGGRGPGGGMAAFFGGRDHSTTTDAQGRFFLEHLPSTPMSLDVRAEGYLDHDQAEVDPTLGQPLQVTLQDGLRLIGRVVDGSDNQPVALFAKRAVRVRGLPPPGLENVDIGQLMTRMRDGNLSDAERQQIRTQMEGLRGQFDFGGRGQRGGPGGGQGGDNGPGGNFGRDLGKPERHADGEFVVTGLQEGIYEVTIQSPEHTRYVSQQIELRYGSAPPRLDITLDGGVYVAGVVTDAKGAPIANVRVELRPATPGGDANQGGRGGRGQRGGQGGQGGPDLQAMANQFTAEARAFQQTQETRSNAEGEFVFKHTGRGTYRVSGSARGYSDARSEVLTVTADLSGVQLQLGQLGTIAGTVRGFRSGEHGEVRVGAIVIGADGGGMGGLGAMFRGRGGNGGPFRTAEIAADGAYQLTDLEPGNYLVRSWVGSPQELMRELGPQLMQGALVADVTVKGGETSRLDLALVRPQLGTVAGSVIHNGNPGRGLQVELASLENANAGDNQGGGMFGGRGGRGMFGRQQQATVDANGRFEIKQIPAGQYRLTVRGGEQGPGGRGPALYEETVAVVADTTLERSLSTSAGSVEGQVTDDGSGAVANLRGNVVLYAGLSELPSDPAALNSMRRQGMLVTQEARLQGGKFRIDNVPPGNYLLVLQVGGRERTTQAIAVGNGVVQVAIAPGQPRPAGEPAAPGQRNR